MNLIKTIIYRTWLQYLWHVPVATGKRFISKTLFALMGEAVFTINGNAFSLAPISYIDDVLLRKGYFDKMILKVLQYALQNGGVFIDIGANFGYYTVVAGKLPGVEVYAVEPSPREFARLKKNIALNKLNNVTALPLALGNENKKMTLFLSDEWNTSMNSFNKQFKSQKGFSSTKQAEVICKRLDDVIAVAAYSSITLIKLDVEGFEWEVLQGMPNLLKAFNGILVCEITPGDNNKNQVERIYQLLQQNGFGALRGIDTEHQYDEVFFKATHYDAAALQQIVLEAS